jgi:protein associated with RNAse G/E
MFSQKKKKERTDQKSAVLCQFFHNSWYNLIHLLETFYYTTEAETFYYSMK